MGAVLGLAIGDAFGMPVAGWSATTITDWYGVVTDFLPRKFPDGDEVRPGEITDETEIALCVIESVTAAHGEIDVENIGIRMNYLARGDSRKWMTTGTAEVLDERSEAAEFRLPLVDDEVVEPDILARGVPIGLMHSMGQFHPAKLRAEAEAVTRITHGSPLAQSLVEAVALTMASAARQSVPLSDLSRLLLDSTGEGELRDGLINGIGVNELSDASKVLCEALAIVANAANLQEALERATCPGGATDSRASLVGALYGGYHGSAAIPQPLIDGLEPRIYVSLAVPWFYRTVARRSGRAIDLRFRPDRF